MEKIRLPFLGPGWFEQAKRAGALKDSAGWYFPPHAAIPPALMARIESAKAPPPAPPPPPGVRWDPPPAPVPVPHDPELLELVDGIEPGEHRSRVIADYYTGKIRAIRSTRIDPLAWARRQRAEPSCHYALALALEALD